MGRRLEWALRQTRVDESCGAASPKRAPHLVFQVLRHSSLLLYLGPWMLPTSPLQPDHPHAFPILNTRIQGPCPCPHLSLIILMRFTS